MKTSKLLLVAWALCASATASLHAQSYTIDPSRSRIAFSVRHLLGTARGEFHKFSGTVVVNAESPERSWVNVKIDVASIDTGIQKRDEHLRSTDFFDEKQFPEIMFRSRAVKKAGPSEAEISGELTMHGVTRSLTLRVKLLTPFANSALPARTRWQVTTKAIRRKDFGLMFGSTAEAVSGIGQEVVPSIEIEIVRGD